MSAPDWSRRLLIRHWSRIPEDLSTIQYGAYAFMTRLDVWWNDEVVNLVSFDEYDETKLSFKSDLNLEQIQIANKIVSYIVDLQQDIEFPSKREQYIFDLKSNLKILKSFLLNHKILNSGSLEYDKFDMEFVY